MKKLICSMLILGFALILISCKDSENTGPKTLDLEIVFYHHLDGLPVEYDIMQYINAAGNLYEVTEVQWFISDVQLLSDPNTRIQLSRDNMIHYVDTNIPETESWFINEIPLKNYQSIRFVFGLTGENNTVGRFTETPEVNMVWPFHMGGDQGGYHYMKLNGFWMDEDEVRQPFNFHLGVGKTMDGEVPVFHQNWFEVELNLPQIDLVKGGHLSIPIIMNIENWFKNPYVWDHNEVGGKIMDNQEAMRTGAKNGETDVFSLGNLNIHE